MQNLLITIRLKNRFISNNNPLDAILCGILFQNGMGGEEAAIGDRLYDTWNGIPMVSCNLTRNDTGVASLVNNMTATVDGQHVLYGIDAPTTFYRNPRMNIINSYKCEENKTGFVQLQYRVRGDKDRIKKLLSDARFIGKKRNVGFGEIFGQPIVEVVESDNPHYGIVHNGQLIRPIPVKYIDELGLDNPVRSYGRWSSPYAPKICYGLGLPLEEIAIPDA